MLFVFWFKLAIKLFKEKQLLNLPFISSYAQGDCNLSILIKI